VVVLLAMLALLLFQLFQPRADHDSTKPVAVAGDAVISDKSIAVLPFDNLNRDAENTSLADGMQDEILTSLAKVSDLRVISRSSVMQYGDATKRNLPEISRALRVAHVLEASVQRTADRVRVNARLIDARNDVNVWAQTYDRDLSTLFAVQSEIAKSVANQLRAKILPVEQTAIEEPPTADLVAFDFYSRAKTLVLTANLAVFKDQLLQAIDFLNQAVARDPEFFLAYCLLAAQHGRLYFLGEDASPERRALAEQAVQAAVRLRPDDGETHLALAQHAYNAYRDYERARAEIALAQRTLPNDPRLFLLASNIDRRQGRWEESARNHERALELDPRNFYILHQLSFSYMALRRYDRMAEVLDRALAISPQDADSRVKRALVDLHWRADTRPLRATIESVLAQEPAAAAKLADSWLTLAFCERDLAAAEQALQALSGNNFGQNVITLTRNFGYGLLARLRGDTAAAQLAFTAARTEQEEVVRAQPDFAPALCVLGMIDAALGRKEEALRAGGRAVELLPASKDLVVGVQMTEFFAITAAWAGENDLAIEQLEATVAVPGRLSYGHLKLHPLWDPLRRDPRFEKIVARLAPQ
jgi:TolB-like protein/Flp pilus assembly protein TadD